MVNSGPHITILVRKHGSASSTLAHKADLAFSDAKATAENLAGNG